jgi:hypothetical protein
VIRGQEIFVQHDELAYSSANDSDESNDPPSSRRRGTMAWQATQTPLHESGFAIPSAFGIRHFNHSCYPWLPARLRGGEADDLLFASDGERAFCRRQKSFFHVFLGAGNKIAAATQVELVLDIFAMALNRFNTEMK